MEAIKADTIKDKVYGLFGHIDKKDIKTLCKILNLNYEIKKFKIIFKILPYYCHWRIHSHLAETIEIDIRQNDCIDKFAGLMQKYFIDEIKFI